VVQASYEVGGFGEGRASARAAPPAGAASRRGAFMESGRLNATNTTWRRARPCPAPLRFTFWHAFMGPLAHQSESVSFVAVPPRSHYTTVSRQRAAPLPPRSTQVLEIKY